MIFALIVSFIFLIIAFLDICYGKIFYTPLFFLFTLEFYHVWYTQAWGDALLNMLILYSIVKIGKFFLNRWIRGPVLGGGDIWLIPLCGPLIDINYLGILIFMIGIFGLGSHYIWRKKYFPFAPAIGLCITILIWWQFWHDL